MNREFEIRVSELNQLDTRQIMVATEGLMLFKTNNVLIKKFTSLLSDITGFVSNKVIAGLLPGISFFGNSDSEITKLKKVLDEYDYLSLRLIDFRIPQGLGIDYVKYVAWLTNSAAECQRYIDKNAVLLLGIIADISNRSDKFSGNAVIPKFEEYDKYPFNKGVRDAFTKGGQSKTRWLNIVKRNGDFINTVEALNDLCEMPIVKDYSKYVSLVKDLTSRVNTFVENISAKDTSIELSPKNITTLSSAILSLAKAVEVFGLLTAYINDYVIVVNDNKQQLLKMK